MATSLLTEMQSGTLKAKGFATPSEDKSPQHVRVPPRKVIPVVFLPGIMGSNLRVTSQRQRLLNNANNAVWRPDKVKEVGSLSIYGPTRRQLQLDHATTEVDSYDPKNNPTGSARETSDERNSNVEDIDNVALRYTSDSPLLVNDPRHGCNFLSIEEKARRRGWGEVFFASYRVVLERLEGALNATDQRDRWSQIIGIDPNVWQAHPEPRLKPLTAEELDSSLSGTLFPVHAMGYNWLRSNRESALQIRRRVLKLLEDYQGAGFQCEKVIILTHSMGGLVARALAHPDIGNLSDKILGVVHGVLPAIGAPAAYKRMRCGFEENLGGADPRPKIVGNKGSEVTAVLGNSPGGLQLLPCRAYGNNWLEVRQNGVLFDSFPKNGDPYEEIYKLRNRWYGLIREEWLNPAELPEATFARTCTFLDDARELHDTLGDYYHPRTFAHYGADPDRVTFDKVVWEIHRDYVGRNWHELAIDDDDTQGTLVAVERISVGRKLKTRIALGAPSGSGDQTVPLRSAEHQLLKGRLRGVFRQTGYEHQASYQDERALDSTLYCVVRIAQKMWWKG
ncbi:esterase/lipase family protein [Pseudoduganella sp. HUAS MS19]